MNFFIRKVREEDAESIVALLNAIIQTRKYTIMEETSLPEQIKFINEFPKQGVYHAAICKNSNQLLGVQDVLPLSTDTSALKHIGEISTFVALNTQRKGIGQSLSKATFQAAKEQGFRKLMATIRADNPQAISFYQRQGFTTIGTAKKHAFVQGNYIDEVLMEKFLD